MGNQLAIMTHCERGDTDLRCTAHIYQDEMAAASVLSGVQQLWQIAWLPGGLAN